MPSKDDFGSVSEARFRGRLALERERVTASRLPEGAAVGRPGLPAPSLSLLTRRHEGGTVVGGANCGLAGGTRMRFSLLSHWGAALVSSPVSRRM
jgi:hypothetical protein